MKTANPAVLVLALMASACGADSSEGAEGSGGGADTGSGGSTRSGGTGGNGPAPGGRSGNGGTTSTATHDICEDLGTTFGMGAAIFGDEGTAWFQTAAETPTAIDWAYGYLYASGDPHDDPDGFEWLVNFRLDTAEQAGATLPTVTFYRMLNVGRDHGHTGSEAQVVQEMLEDAEAMSDYLDDFVAVLDILATRGTPPLLHIEPDSWGFMMWAFDGFDGTTGNANASAIPVSLGGHPALAGQAFANDAGGLGQALLYLRDQHAPEVRLGWHASNFRVGTRPEVVTGFYSSTGAWDVIVTEPPHMNGSGSATWNVLDEDNQNNLTWLGTVSATTGLPILIWQTYVDDAEPYLGAWPNRQDNLAALAEQGVAGVLWDPNGNGGDCRYSCTGANVLRDHLSAYSAAPLALPSHHVCGG